MVSDTNTDLGAQTGSDPDAVSARLIQAALEVFEERGYEKAGVQEIARRAGLTTGAIYNRFSGKDELLRAALANCIMTDEVYDDPRATDVTSILSLLGASVLEDDTDGMASRLMLNVVSASGREPALAEMMEVFVNAESDRIEELVEQAKADGLFDTSLETHAVAMLCQSIGLGFMTLRALGITMPNAAAWDHVIATLIEAAMPGALQTSSEEPVKEPTQESIEEK